MSEVCVSLVVGGSRGIGLSVAGHLSSTSSEVYSVSRSHAPFGTWIQADIATNVGLEKIRDLFAGKKIDNLLFMGGTWEHNAFTKDYAFLSSSFEEIEKVINTNLLGPIKLSQILLPSLKLSENPKVIFIGSLSGLENCASREVANSASKYGLRGAAQALTKEFQHVGVGFTVINPGNVATDEVIQDINSGVFNQQVPIPIKDLLKSIDFVLSLTKYTYIQEINIGQVNGGKK